eukprot:1913229-Pleurochrysis_carterae.AAC.1
MQPLSSCARRPPHSPVLPVPFTRGSSPKSTLLGWCLRRIHSRPSPACNRKGGAVPTNGYEASGS